jgi:hypothetical protein
MSSEKLDVRLVDVRVDSQLTALNVMVGFLNMAQRRGAFDIQESAKIYECIRLFNQDEKPKSSFPEENSIIA